MNILLLYISPNRTTEKISRVLNARFTQDGHTVRLVNIGKHPGGACQPITRQVFQAVDLIGIGSPVFHMRMLGPMQAYLQEALPHIAPTTKVFIYLTYGGITTGKAFINTVKQLVPYDIRLAGGFKVWAPHFYNPAIYPDPAALQTVDDFCTQLSANRFRSMDWDRAKRLFSPQSKKVNLIYPLTEIIGKFRELPIRIDRQKCIQCKRCSSECPVNAIEMRPYPVRDASRCIYCYHCTTACPQKAVLCPTEKVEKMVRVNKKIVGREEPQNEVFL